MKVLQVLWEGGGNVAPQLGIARELLGRGHEVTVLGSSCLREKVEASGAEFRPVRHGPDHDASRRETDILRDWEARTPPGAFARVRDRLMYGPALEYARDVLDALEESPADVVVWDYLMLGAGVGAEAAGAKSVVVVHNIYPAPLKGVPPFGLGFPPAGGVAGRLRDAAVRPVFELLFRPGLKALNNARTELGLAPQDGPFEALATTDLAVVLTSASFDFAGTAELPANVRFVGPVIDRRDPGEWDSLWPESDERPLVLASFSTTFMDQRGLFERTVEALAELPVRGLLTTGPAIDPAELPRADNVEVRKFVPHAAVLPEARAAITHGGMGTVHAALAAGVPIVCLPQGRDQPDVAARIVASGAGVRLGAKPSAAKLRRAVTETLGDPAYATAASRFADEFSREDGAGRTADELEALAG